MEIIAEIGVHHEGDLGLALRYVNSAKMHGADAVKFQMYDADSLCQIDSPVYWETKEKTQHEVFSKKKHLTLEEWEFLRNYCKEQDIRFYVTPFSFKHVSWCEAINVDAYKIASADITYHQLIDRVARTRKPVYMSTGGASTGEIYSALARFTHGRVTLLHCSLIYPSTIADARVGRFKYLKNMFPQVQWGYSCHVPMPESLPVISAMQSHGAAVLEKHFTITPEKDGDDHYHSMNPQDLALIKETSRLMDISCSVQDVTGKELDRVKFARRSLVLTRDLECGILLVEGDMEALRPANGTSPAYYRDFIGKTLTTSKKKGELLTWKDIEK